MSSKPAPPRQVPTLTEVVQFTEMANAPVVEETASAQATVAVAGAPQPSASLPLTTEEQIAQRVLADLQRQIDLMLEHRLRELLAPAVARMADQLVRDTRTELASTLRDVIAKAVAQELARFRGR